MQKKIMILGATGKVGEAICNKLKSRTNHHLIILSSKYEKSFLPNVEVIDFDINDKKALKKTISAYIPDVIINAVAYTNVDGCEDDKKGAMALNSDLPETLAKAAKSLSSKLIHFSTDYIFDGKAGPYSEDAIPNPLSFYGKSKLAGENAIKANIDNFLILRTNIVYGNSSYGKNDFVRWICENLKVGKKLNIITGQVGNPTFTEDIAEAVLRFIEKDSKGVFNLAGSDLLNRYEIAVKIAEICGYDAALISPTSPEKLVQKAKRPELGGLTNIKTLKEIDYSPGNLKHGLDNLFQRISNI